jgi:ribose/xylose/arabinose/galactoside ABC-type transport system permease subunit
MPGLDPGILFHPNKEDRRIKSGGGVTVGRTESWIPACAGMTAVVVMSLPIPAAAFDCAKLGSVDPNAGAGIELSAIAAVVVGGTSLMGGRGSVFGSFLGVLIISTLGAGLANLGASDPVKLLVTGLVIVLAAVADVWRGRR